MSEILQLSRYRVGGRFRRASLVGAGLQLSCWVCKNEENKLVLCREIWYEAMDRRGWLTHDYAYTVILTGFWVFTTELLGWHAEARPWTWTLVHLGTSGTWLPDFPPDAVCVCGVPPVLWDLLVVLSPVEPQRKHIYRVEAASQMTRAQPVRCPTLYCGDSSIRQWENLAEG